MMLQFVHTFSQKLGHILMKRRRKKIIWTGAHQCPPRALSPLVVVHQRHCPQQTMSPTIKVHHRCPPSAMSHTQKVKATMAIVLHRQCLSAASIKEIFAVI